MPSPQTTSAAQKQTTNLNTSTESRALTLLGQGIAPGIVAATCGVSESRISQLISNPEFAAQVAELRFAGLQKHNARDNSYDQMEDTLIEKLKDLLPLMMRPMEVLKAIQVINQAKRRGQSAPESILQQNTVINLTIPTQIIQRFQTNAQNMVVQAGNQELLTLQASSLLGKVKGNNHDSPRIADLSAASS
jgi:hypothetical protein